MPDHPFELLNEQRFQQFSQALIALGFPRAQCLPVAQPDGGRDALAKPEDGDGLIVFQVKFARSPTNLKDPVKWIEDVLNGERPKIENLIERGATEYKLVTNFSATAHLDGGSFDKVQKVLAELPIPAECWWRDDLNRRLEGAFDLKLSYPELLIGNDILRILAERNGNDEEAIRRQRAIKAYLVEQYDEDREVRFKQADLVNGLLKFFIDVPAKPLVSFRETEELARIVRVLKRREARSASEDEGAYEGGPRELVHGASSLLLHGPFHEQVRCAVVEGAPGQGKSTMLQYICQVHRARILESDDIAEIPKAHLASPLRMPLKVDLRDFARWLVGGNVEDGDEEGRGQGRSLEGFLAAVIEESSGGAPFNVADLQAVVGETSVLLALDGLDEVGDTGDREKVVKAIDAAVRRLETLAPSFQAIVTSRPASFGGASVFPRVSFHTLRLQSLERSLIKVYAAKWMRARRLNRRERIELSETLDEKLDEPHIRDIAQNPMQLAILLDLVHRRGSALPDQRTDLYRSYMEMFLDRESEKSQAVLKYRNLVLGLHGYLAWLLHSLAEESGEVGRFTFEEAEKAVGDFLEGKGFERDLLGDLFAGVFDRVGALVSHFPGTYEFEVQPLREFFAARHLYETASYSTAGDVKSGTRPERLDAIARRPYWLNVTRFYAGSYDSGELASLADRLAALHEDPVWGTTTHPGAVAARLLADRTFQQERRIQDLVTDLLGKDLLARGWTSDSGSEYIPQAATSLPFDCGGEELAEIAWGHLREADQSDRRAALAAVVNAQVSDRDERRSRWLADLRELDGDERDRWYRSANDLKLGETLTAQSADLSEDAGDATLGALLAGGQFAVFDDREEVTGRVLKMVLESPGIVEPSDRPHHPIPALAELLRLDQLQARMMSGRKLSAMGEAAGNETAGYRAATEFIRFAVDLIPENEGDWRSKLAPWDRVVERGRELLGECTGLTELAVATTGIAGSAERGNAYGDLFDTSLPLCWRAHYARIGGGDQRWWQERLAEPSSDDERVMGLALAWCWADEETLKTIMDDLLRVQDELSERSRGRLVDLIARCLSRIDPERLLPIRRIRWLGALDALTFACASQRMPKQVARDLYLKSGPFEDEAIAPVLDLLSRYEFESLGRDPGRWEEATSLMKRRMAAYDWSLPWTDPELGQWDQDMPPDLAQALVQDAAEYPLALVARAEACRMRQVQFDLESVAKVAQKENWFS